MSNQEDPQPNEVAPQRWLSARTSESLIDRQIRAAEEAGQLRDLPGAGRPLDLDDDRGVPDELRAGFRLLKNAGCAPPWIELQRSIREEQAALEGWLAGVSSRWPTLGPRDRAALRVEHERRLRELNRQIMTYNLTAPPAAGQIPLVRSLRPLGA